MKLQEGAYENVITGELQQDMVLAEDGGLVCKQEDIDNAEYTSMLVDHVSKIIHNRLSDDNLSSGEKTDFINQLTIMDRMCASSIKGIAAGQVLNERPDCVPMKTMN